jgi:hypothetical protein
MKESTDWSWRYHCGWKPSVKWHQSSLAGAKGEQRQQYAKGPVVSTPDQDAARAKVECSGQMPGPNGC